jgi:3-hydroxymyristoyl/3-hydroxydecanoyl-(acyl carrier protein) dehydratase
VLPHRFPLRLVDRRQDGEVVVETTVGGAYARGASGLPGSLSLEILAQAAHLLLAPAATGPVYLAGVEDAEFPPSLEPGTDLRATARLEARVGEIVKVAAKLETAGRQVARVQLWLRTGSRDVEGE